MSSPLTPRRTGELTLREMARWSWRQLTSMRTALILLLLLALAAVPGSIVPQEDVDSLKTSRWQEAHPTLTPIYERLGLAPAALDAVRADIRAMVPLGRFGEPHEIAAAAVFLASDESSFVVGAELVVDGGMSQL